MQLSMVVLGGAGLDAVKHGDTKGSRHKSKEPFLPMAGDEPTPPAVTALIPPTLASSPLGDSLSRLLEILGTPITLNLCFPACALLPANSWLTSPFNCERQLAVTPLCRRNGAQEEQGPRHQTSTKQGQNYTGASSVLQPQSLGSSRPGGK